MAALALALSAPTAKALSTYYVEIDTTALEGRTASMQFLAFDLIGQDQATENNLVTAFDFDTDGALTDTSNLELKDTEFFNEVTRDITFGKYLNFTLTLSENNAPPGIDQFSFFIIDYSTDLPLVESDDPTGAHALFAIDITGTPGGTLSLFKSTTYAVSWDVFAPTPPPPSVPDSGGTLTLLMVSSAMIGLRRALSRSHGL